MLAVRSLPKTGGRIRSAARQRRCIRAAASAGNRIRGRPPRRGATPGTIRLRPASRRCERIRTNTIGRHCPCHFALKLLRQRIELALRGSQRLRFITKHALRGAFDILLQALNFFVRALLERLRLAQEISL